MTKNNPTHQIRRYYVDVDGSTLVKNGFFKTSPESVARIGALFHEAAVYDRQGQVFRGKAAILDFFENQRSLCGRHSIESVVQARTVKNAPPLDTSIVVKGVFKGKLYTTRPNSGRKITGEKDMNLRFTDHWGFHAGKVIYRRSDIVSAPAAAMPKARTTAR